MDAFVKYLQDMIASESALLDAPIGNGRGGPLNLGSKKKALLLSPHPDDELVTGLWPHRLMNECGWEIVNVAVTLGSDKTRREKRLGELVRACDHIGFRLALPGPDALEMTEFGTGEDRRAHWEYNVTRIAEIIEWEKPRVVFMPHLDDGHPRHQGTHALGSEALRALGGRFDPLTVVETEYWRQMGRANAVVEGSVWDVASLMKALRRYEGEIARNPFHTALPHLMMDNVRRAELFTGIGQPAPDMHMATIYRYTHWDRGRASSPKYAKLISVEDNPEMPLLTMS